MENMQQTPESKPFLLIHRACQRQQWLNVGWQRGCRHCALSIYPPIFGKCFKVTFLVFSPGISEWTNTSNIRFGVFISAYMCSENFNNNNNNKCQTGNFWRIQNKYNSLVIKNKYSVKICSEFSLFWFLAGWGCVEGIIAVAAYLRRRIEHYPVLAQMEKWKMYQIAHSYNVMK